MMREKNGTESAEFLSASARLTATFSESCLRGIVVLLDHVEGKGDQRMATVVLGWSQKLIDAADSVRKSLNSRGGPGGASAAPRRLNITPGMPNTSTVTRFVNIDDF